MADVNSKTVSGIACSNTSAYIWVRLWTKIGGTWRTPYDYRMNAPPPEQCVDGRAKLLTPTPGSATPLSKTQTFTWSAGIGAEMYWLDVGRSIDVGDIYPAEAMVPGEIPKEIQSKTVELPCAPQTLHVQVHTKISGTWQAPFKYTFIAPPPAECVVPVLEVVPESVVLLPYQNVPYTVLENKLPIPASRTIQWSLGTMVSGVFTPLPAGSGTTYGTIDVNTGAYSGPASIPQTLFLRVRATATGGTTPLPAPAYGDIELRPYYPPDCAYRMSTSSANNLGESAEYLMWQQSMTCAGSGGFRPSVQTLISNSPAGVAEPNMLNQCYVVYHPGAGQMLQLWNDSVSEPARPSNWMPLKANVSSTNAILLEGKGMATNSQCLIDYARAWERFGGEYQFMIWNMPIYFHRPFAGTKEVRMRENSSASPWKLISPWTVPDSPQQPPTGAITYPAENQTVSGVITVTGWALDNAAAIESPIQKIKVYFDGEYMGTANLNQESTACATYPGRHGCPNVGFSFPNLNVSAKGVGSHVLEFVVYDSDIQGQKLTVLRRQIQVN